MQSPENKLPSNKVGLVLIVVVLIVAGAIFSSKIRIKTPTVDLQNVELVVERKTDTGFKSGDSDGDGLSDWLEEIYKSDPLKIDTDGDGTNDGEEVNLKRNPVIAGPNDKMISVEEYFANKDYSSLTFATDTLTSKLSIDLFSQYLNDKKDGLLTPEEKDKIVQDVSQKATEGFKLTNQFSSANIKTVQAITESNTAYGDTFAQENISFLTQLDLQKDLQETQYLLKIGQMYKDFAITLSKMNVPTPLVDIHVEIVNNTYNTGVLYIELSKSGQDSITKLVLLSKLKVNQERTANLYNMLAQYFKNNGIIFSIDASVKFWNNF